MDHDLMIWLVVVGAMLASLAVAASTFVLLAL